MFQSPGHVVIGATDLPATSRFLQALGFAERGRAELPAAAAAALYGLEGKAEEAWLGVPGAPAGGIRVVGTPHPAPAVGPFDRGAHAIDLYTTDIARSLESAAAAGAKTHEFAEYKLGPLTIREGKAVGPDALYVVFIQVGQRRPSVLDADPARLNSEVHSAVWVVDSVGTALPFWRDRVGFEVLLDATLAEPGVAKFMGLPRPDTPIRLAVMADAAQRPVRFELLEFPEDAGPARPGFPLRGGLHAVAFDVASLDAARRALPEVAFDASLSCDTPLHPRARAASGEAPGRVRLELWEGPVA